MPDVKTAQRPQIVPGFDPTPAGSTPPPAPVTVYGVPPPEGLLDCVLCPVRAEAMQVVPGEGPADAQVYFLGQNPGEEEDLAGRPFVGLAGHEFDHWLTILGLQRTRVYVSNVVKCHTYGNRVPRSPEVQTCSNRWLPEELSALTALQVLIPLGKPASERILGKTAPPMLPLAIYHFRIEILGRPVSVFPLPHPAFLLRMQHYKRSFYEVLLPQVRETLEQELPAVYRDASRKD